MRFLKKLHNFQFIELLQDLSGNVKAEKLDRTFTRFIIFIFVGLLIGLSATVVYPAGCKMLSFLPF